MIKVTHEVVSTAYLINKALKQLNEYPILSFDTETEGLYSKLERKEAVKYLKNNNITVDNKRIAMQIANNSGLSFPSLVSTTHFVFGVTEYHSVIIVCSNMHQEIQLWEWVSNYKGKFLIHNTLFDLKIMYNRIGKFPIDYEDTQLLAKTLINHVDVWKAKVGLKDLMGSYYDPAWSLYKNYEPDNLKDPNFLIYAATDGAATIKLWNDMQIRMGYN